jgi:hypothetical protein
VPDPAVALDWGNGWVPVEPGNPMQTELMAELGKAHPLKRMKPSVFGRCLDCDDVVASLAGGPVLAVVHLTWKGGAEARRKGDAHWPYFECLTTSEFTRRFLRGREHL